MSKIWFNFSFEEDVRSINNSCFFFFALLAFGWQVNLTKQDVNRYVKWFHTMDTEKAGFVTVNELRKHLQSASGPAPSGSDQLHALSDEEIHDLLSELDIHSNGRLELGEFLQLMSALKTGAICQSSLAKFVEIASKRISVERSGGGV